MNGIELENVDEIRRNSKIANKIHMQVNFAGEKLIFIVEKGDFLRKTKVLDSNVPQAAIFDGSTLLVDLC